ncbi:hypothetical protein TNCV_2578091 [Trichonephila clavipes]|nr:hypothetical protein TNCV_2578091 [Trichonephila clavipes]
MRFVWVGAAARGTQTFRDVKIHASKLRLLACRRSSNCNDLLPNMKTQRSAMSLKRLLPDTGLRVLRTQVPELIPAESQSGFDWRSASVAPIVEAISDY